VLDDLQWAGADALELLASLLQAPARPLRVLGAYRSTEVAPQSPLAVALAAGLLGEAEADQWCREAYDLLLALGQAQVARVGDQALDRVFIDTLQSLLDQGAVGLHIEHCNPHTGKSETVTAGGGAVIGHVLGDGIALFAAEGDSGMAVGAYRLVQEHIRRAGQPWNHTWHAVGRYLREGGWLAAHEAERFTIQRSINGRKKRVVLLRADALTVPSVPGFGSHDQGDV
jgi:hypothetical protein